MKMELSLRLDKTLFEKKVPPKKITDKTNWIIISLYQRMQIIIDYLFVLNFLSIYTLSFSHNTGGRYDGYTKTSWCVFEGFNFSKTNNSKSKNGT